MKFKVLLVDSGLTVGGNYSPFAAFIQSLGWDSEEAQGLMLINLISTNPQFAWYTQHLELNTVYSKEMVMNMLLSEDVKERPAKQITNAFKRISETPFGRVLNFGSVSKEGTLTRTKCVLTDFRVFLYGLFRFAEKCNDYKKFTLGDLLNDGIERDGISPTRIFGMGREDATPLLKGLSARYPDFIVASFTHDLEKISLSEEKTSLDVMDLWKNEE